MGKKALIGSGALAAVCIAGAWGGIATLANIPSVHGAKLLTGTGEMLYCYAEPTDCVDGMTLTSTKSISDLLDYTASVMALETEINPDYKEQFQALQKKVTDAKESSAEITSPVIYSSVLRSISQDLKGMEKLDDAQDALAFPIALGLVCGLFSTPWFIYNVYESITTYSRERQRRNRYN
jgi:hypothetical protein